ncbi:hypothetical protein Pst134EA_007495 [Puccinia striiformis f. sp. tritici]|uniref:hypothetical protein n=1 Tax=Puccinia striiformis f. sp. tritici TaxID=168172 RepID=UPI0020089F7A|nr:hypothetical protein Pst134EA_007495 [Puccinia striiformis f. sp. tritici]KAH9470230.1 hypothetical protein Pst134EA_007495 [Puccinia striiformis f. sp. tritici]KAI9626844.1 hypothetical protein KEM48_010132 [Puccinia striiformis f. sp. tritici PST-130]
MSYRNQPTPLNLYDVATGYYTENFPRYPDGSSLASLDRIEKTSPLSYFIHKEEPTATHLSERELTMQKYTGGGNPGAKIHPMDTELIFDGVSIPVNKFIQRYESAGKSDRATAKDLAEQILPFIKGDLKAEVEEMSGYIDADWEALKIQLLDRFGQGLPLVKPGTLNTQGPQAQKEVPAPGAHSLLGRLEESQTAKLTTDKIGNTECLRSGKQVAGTINAEKLQEAKEVLLIKDDEGRTHLAPVITTPADQKCEAIFSSSITCASNVVTVAGKASDNRFLERPRLKEEPALVHTTNYKSNANEIKLKTKSVSDRKALMMPDKPFCEPPSMGEIDREERTIDCDTNPVISTTAVTSANLGVETTGRSHPESLDRVFLNKKPTNSGSVVNIEQVALGTSMEEEKYRANDVQITPRCLSFIEKNPQDASNSSLARPATVANSIPATILKKSVNMPRLSRILLSFFKELIANHQHYLLAFLFFVIFVYNLNGAKHSTTRATTCFTNQRGDGDAKTLFDLRLSSLFLSDVRADYTTIIETDWGDMRGLALFNLGVMVHLLGDVIADWSTLMMTHWNKHVYNLLSALITEANNQTCREHIGMGLKGATTSLTDPRGNNRGLAPHDLGLSVRLLSNIQADCTAIEKDNLDRNGESSMLALIDAENHQTRRKQIKKMCIGMMIHEHRRFLHNRKEGQDSSLLELDPYTRNSSIFNPPAAREFIRLVHTPCLTDWYNIPSTVKQFFGTSLKKPGLIGRLSLPPSGPLVMLAIATNGSARPPDQTIAEHLT